MKRVRLGIIGTGIMGSAHARNIAKLVNVDLVAICDTDRPRADALSKELTCAAFYDPAALIGSGTVNAVLIATPHYSHTTIGIEALKAGLHVLVEKPISVHKADCERLIAAHTNPAQIFVAMFMQRTIPFYKKIREMVANGDLGQLRRVNWIITDWFRTHAYYANGGWRATWKGEGGGVLLNQCPHNIDLMQWMFGMPCKIRANCWIGKWHPIEVEDEVTAFWEYPNGATAVFVTSTGEAPGTNRLEVCGERGKLVFESGKLTFTRNEVEMSQFSKTTTELFSAPKTETISITCDNIDNMHNIIIQNFVNAIIDPATPLLAPAAEGIRSVELANSMLYSSMNNVTVKLPLDGVAYEAMLKKLISESPLKKQ